MTGVRTRTALVAIASAAALLACHARPRTWTGAAEVGASGASTTATTSSGGGDVAEIDLSRGAPELASRSLFGGTPTGSFFQLVKLVRQIADGDGTKSVFVRFGSTRIGWSRAEELATLLSAVRKAGRPVVCHADGYTNATAWVAAQGCERIWLSPAGEVEANGIAAQVVYANRLLTKKLGVDVDFLQMGKFKGAEEPLTREGPSPEARESLESTLAAIRKTWIAGFEARGAAAVAAAEDGPFGPAEAKARGLVDAVGYLDEARDEAKKRGGVEQARLRFGPSARSGGELAELLRALAGGGPASGGAPHVTVVRAVGAIAMSGGGGLFGDGSGISERALGRTVRALEEDDATKAVVLRIDSPGGSALASDLLWHALMQLRAKKPIVVSVGDMAASGGYYLASTANKIVAEPTSIVGSIGVVGGKLAFGNALEQIGVHVETFSAKSEPAAAARAGYESPFVPWDDATRERVRASMKGVYDLFLSRVAEGRGVPVEKIAASAEGRIFAGDEAMTRGLVDEWGGIEKAIAIAKDLAKLRADAPVKLAGERGGLLEMLDPDDDGSDDESRAAATAGPFAAPAAAIGALAPELATFVSSAAPMLRGERTLAAVPFAMILR